MKDFLLQRALQTQLYYLADMRDEPTAVWLAKFLGHEHLDGSGRFAALNGMRVPWREYHAQLRVTPAFSLTVELAPARASALSAQARRNPFLAAASEPVRTYEEV